MGGDPPPNLACPGPIASGTISTTYQIDPAHDGAQPNDQLSLPLCRRWMRTLHAKPTSLVIASGRVFVTVQHKDGSSSLFALDAKTGYDLWPHIDFGGQTGCTVAGATLFVIDGKGNTTGYDPATGAQQWSSSLFGQLYFKLSPVAIGSKVLVIGDETGATLYCVDPASGAVDWYTETADVPMASASATVAYTAVAQLNAVDVQTGSPIWPWHPDSVSSSPAPLLDDRVYVQGSQTFSATTGAVVGFTSFDRPVALLGAGFVLGSSHGRIVAVPPGEVTPTWAFGSGELVTAPIVVGSDVVVAAGDGTVEVVRATDGALISSIDTGSTISAPDFGSGLPFAGLAEADGLLVVPTDTGLVAY